MLYVKLMPTSVIAVIALAVVAQLGDITAMMGAHPWWSTKVIWVGALIGVCVAAVAWILRLPKHRTALAFACLAVLAFSLARLGQTAFTHSFGEAALAGQLWYGGWIITCAMVSAVLATLANTAPKIR